MTSYLIAATIRPDSPRAAEWLEVFGAAVLPLASPVAHEGTGPDGRRHTFYRVAHGQLDADVIRRLIAHVGRKWGIGPEEVAGQLDDPGHGLNILADDVIVTVDARLLF